MTESTEVSVRENRRVAPYVAGAVGVVIAMFLVILVLANSGEVNVARSPLLGKPAPAVNSTIIDGGDFSLERRKGSWLLLNFFNSTCVPCIQEHPYLVNFADAQKTNDDPVEVYTIVNDDNDNAVRAFFRANGGDWPKVRDDDGAISVAFGVSKVPESWIVDPNGFVRLRILGAVTDGFLEEQVDLLKRQFAGIE
jgi:cytochrome c biogenesis protein CcmG, thiol:disulfide interchange protein DsbE